jgi:osmotically-inducible protein OsmY
MKIQLSRLFAYLAVAMLIAITACSPTRTRETTGEYVDDVTITTKVKAALINDPAVKARDVKVETFRGVVQLSGFVDSPAQAAKATEVAKEVGGVKSVKNDLAVKQQ